MDDVDKALAGSWKERKAALLRLVMGSYNKGWDECDQAYREALALAGLPALPVPGPRTRVQ